MPQGTSQIFPSLHLINSQFMPTVTYEVVVPYMHVVDGRGALHPRPCLAVSVIGPGGPFDVVAHVDSGSRYVVFDGQIAEAVGLNLGAGEYIGLQAAAGAVVPARFHNVTLEVEGHRFPCRVAFTEMPIPRCLLGRTGFFNLWQTGFRESLSELYLSPDPLANELTPTVAPVE